MSVYIIGGPARTGKTTLYYRVRSVFDGDCIDIDPLRFGMRLLAEQQPGHPLLLTPSVSDPRFYHDDPMVARQKRQVWVAELQRRDRAYWDIFAAYIFNHQIQYGGDLLMVGPFWPSHVVTLPATVDVKHVTLVDTSQGRSERLIRIARSERPTSNNWQRGWDDDKIRVWAEFDYERNIALKTEAVEAGCSYVDLADYAGDDEMVFRQTQDAAAALLGYPDQTHN